MKTDWPCYWLAVVFWICGLAGSRIDQAEIEIELGADAEDQWFQAAERGEVEILEERIEIAAHVEELESSVRRIHEA